MVIKEGALHHYLDHPEDLALVDRDVLTRYATDHPYSAHIHLLRFVQHLYQTGEIDQELMATAATYLPDRTLIGSYIQRYRLGTSQPVAQQAESPQTDLSQTSDEQPSEGSSLITQPSDPSIIPDLADFSWTPPQEQEILVQKTRILEKKDRKPKKRTKAKTDKPTKSSPPRAPDQKKPRKKKKSRLTKVLEDPRHGQQEEVKDRNQDEFVTWLRRMDRLGSQTGKKGQEKTTSTKNPTTKTKKKSKGKIRVSQEAREKAIMSETLADLLAQQGRTKKAIKMYENLRLKYPEKSSFFALKIKDLQAKI